FIALATSPQVQADGIVKKFNWYPGIDAKNLEGKLDKAAWDRLFTDITPADLSKNAKPFPIAPYFNDILAGYQKKLANSGAPLRAGVPNAVPYHEPFPTPARLAADRTRPRPRRGAFPLSALLLSRLGLHRS